MPAQRLNPIRRGGATGALTSRAGIINVYGEPVRDYWAYDTPSEPGDTLTPVEQADGSWLCTVPARADAATLTKRRCEIHWGVDFKGGVYRHGDTIRYNAELIGSLGAAGHDPQEWHVLHQVHGATAAGAWNNPCVCLVASAGNLQLRGGYGHPNHVDTLAGCYGWNHIIAPWVDGRRYHIDATYHIDNGAAAWIDLVVDGVHILDHWVPEGIYQGQPTGNRPGTLYCTRNNTWAWCMLRSALYRGSNNNDPPTTYAQWVRHWPILLGYAPPA